LKTNHLATLLATSKEVIEMSKNNSFYFHNKSPFSFRSRVVGGLLAVPRNVDPRPVEIDSLHL
jgi:hypothetical protein